MLPETTKRVMAHTTDRINEDIRKCTAESISYYSSAAFSALDQRLRELDAEWNIERTLEANAATLAFLGVGLAALVSKKWLILPGVVTGFLLQHALQGWCPPLPVFRRYGIRTPREIEIERNSLKLLRGDFKEASDLVSQGNPDPEKIMASVER
jgi:hypothetical protein